MLFRLLRTFFALLSPRPQKLGHASEALLHAIQVKVSSHILTLNTSGLHAWMWCFFCSKEMSLFPAKKSYNLIVEEVSAVLRCCLMVPTVSSVFGAAPNNHVCEGRLEWWFALSDRLQLCCLLNIAKVCGNASLFHSDRSATGHYPWARPHRLIQKGHGRMEISNGGVEQRVELYYA